MAAHADHPLVLPTDDELLQAQADLWRHSLYYLKSMTLRCAVELGIPTAIHSLGVAASLPDVVAALSLPPSKLQFLQRLMRLLATSGVFSADDTAEVGTVYRLTPLSWLLVEGDVVDGHPGQASVAVAPNSRHCLEAALGFAEWFKKDHLSSSPPSPFEEVHGATLWQEGMAEVDLEFGMATNEALAAHDSSGFATVLRECGDMFQGLQSLTDCGGGDGTAARAIVEAFPHIACTVLDLPRVIGNAPAGGVVNYVAGDLFHVVPPAQAVMLKLVLHHWSDEDCVKILTQCKNAIPSREAGGKLIIVDIVVGSSSGPTLEAELLMDIGFMLVSKGRQRDEKDWSEMFTKAGYSDYKLVN